MRIPVHCCYMNIFVAVLGAFCYYNLLALISLKTTENVENTVCD